MSLRVIGGAGGNPAQVNSYTIPATITSNTDLAVAPNVPSAPTTPFQNVVVTGKVTNYRDNPGMSSISVKTLTSPGQVEALRSAARNTAVAFGLNVSISSDRATRLQNQIIADSLSVLPIIVDNVFVPS